MTNVEYTEEFNTVSSLVDDVYYNDNDKTMAVDLNDQIYRYNGVPRSVFEAFREAPSKGRFYTANVKRAYGPGEALGWYDNIVFNKVSNNTTSLGNVSPVRVSGVGTPKGLTYAPDAIISDNRTSAVSMFSLATNTPNVEPAVRKHTVTFLVNGQPKVHTLTAKDVDEAIAVVKELGDMLDLTFVIKEVTVYFE